MKKTILASILLIVCANSFSGLVDLPKERIELPVVQGNHLVCIWDDSVGDWLIEFQNYDHAGVLEFQLPEWEKWYWVGLWDIAAEKYVASKWIGHFDVTE